MPATAWVACASVAVSLLALSLGYSEVSAVARLSKHVQRVQAVYNGASPSFQVALRPELQRATARLTIILDPQYRKRARLLFEFALTTGAMAVFSVLSVVLVPADERDLGATVIGFAGSSTFTLYIIGQYRRRHADNELKVKAYADSDEPAQPRSAFKPKHLK